MTVHTLRQNILNLTLESRGLSIKASRDNIYLDVLNNFSQKVFKAVACYDASAKEKSCSCRCQLYSTLSAELRYLAQQVKKTKTILEKILWYLGFLIKEEAVLWKTIYFIEKALVSATKSKSTLIQENTPYLESRKLTRKQAISTPEYMVKRAYMRVLGQQTLKQSLQWIVGDSQDKAIKTIHQDIKKFLQKVPVNNHEKQALHQVLAVLKRALSLFENTQPIENDSKDTDLLLSNFIYENIYLPVSTLKNKEVIIFPGGYLSSKSGHAMIYQIQKTGSTYSFTVINTGEDCVELNLAGKRMCQDTVYTDLSFEQVTSDALWAFLIDLSFRCQNIRKPIHAIYKHLHKYFKDRGKFSTLTNQHKLQGDGTCSHESLIAWLEINLDKDLFDLLHLFIIKEGMNLLHAVQMPDTMALKKLGQKTWTLKCNEVSQLQKQNPTYQYIINSV